MPSEIKAVLFDIGGVLVRTDDHAPRVRLAGRFGLDRAGIDNLVFGNPIAQAVERGEAEEAAIWENVRSQLSLSADGLREFQDEFWRGDTLDVALFDLLASLHARCRIGLLTNSWLPDPLALFWTRFGLPETAVRAAVDVVVSSALVGVRKPDARIYQAALDALGTAPHETVFVDDFAHNIQAARAMGLQTVWFENADQARRDLLALIER